MSKLNNSRILLAILLLAIFIVFSSSSIALVIQPYFCNLDYVGKYESNEYGFAREIKITIMFEEYGRFRITGAETINGQRQPTTYSETGTYEFTSQYSKEPYFKLENYWLNLHYRNAFQLEYSDAVLTNISAICLLIFYLLMSIGSLACAIVLFLRRKNGKKVFGNISRMQAQIEELEKQIEALKNRE